MHHRVLGAEIADGQEEAVRVLDERDERAERERAGADLTAAVPDQKRQRDGAERLHRRVQRGLEDRRVEQRAAVVVVEPAEHRVLVPLAREELHDGHPLQRLLQEGVERGQPPPRLPVRVAGAQAEVRGDPRQHRHDGEGHQGQPPVHPQHHGHDADERDHVGGDGEQAAGERFADGLDVVEHAGHQAADRIAVVEARLQTQQVLEERRAQIVGHALAHERHQVGLEAAQRIEDAERARIRRRRERQPDPVAREDVIVDGDLQEIGLGQLRQRDRGKERQRGVEHGPLRAGSRPQAAREPPVEGAAEHLVVVERGAVRHARSLPRAVVAARGARRGRRRPAASRDRRSRRDGRRRERPPGPPPARPAAGASSRTW